MSSPLCPPQIPQGLYLGPNPGLSSERTASNGRNYSHKNKTINQYEERPPHNNTLPTSETISNHNSECTTFHCGRQGGASCGSVWRETVACRPLGRSSLTRTPTHPVRPAIPCRRLAILQVCERMPLVGA